MSAPRPIPQQLLWQSAPIADLPLDGQPLDLDVTLSCGQTFRWAKVGPDWEGIVGRQIFRIRTADDRLMIRYLPPADSTRDPVAVAALMRHYFWLDLDARAVQEQIARAHPLAAAAIARLPGLRVARQEFREAALSFSIASATNVPRITRSIANLCALLGEPIGAVGGADSDRVEYRVFPTPAAILAADPTTLAGPCNLAYRALHLQAMARALLRNAAEWPAQLAAAPYPEAHARLDAIRHVGPKIADCICLFGLGRPEAVPIDAHVWAIAHDLFPGLIRTRSLTEATYRQIGAAFRAAFGTYAGWAQQYLYTARRMGHLR